MHLQRLEGALLTAAMPGILATVAEAEPADDLGLAEEDLLLNYMQAWRLVNGAAGYIVTGTAFVKTEDGKDSQTTALWVRYAAGRCLRYPRRVMREIGEELIEIATAWGCMEMRVEGVRARQWLLVLPGFEIIRQDGPVAVLRKVLL